MTEEVNYFTCGYCIYGQMVEAPEEKKKDYPHKRGYCIFEPPKVFPMPQPQESKIQAMGNVKKQMDLVPFMMRPIMEEYEPMCGRGVLTVEAAQALGLDKPPVDCRNCKDQGTCNCDTENEDGSK